MGDYLDKVVQKCENNYDCSKLVLSSSGTSNIQFELPISINLQQGDIIEFYAATIHGLTDPYITHDDYYRAEVYRKAPSRKKELVVRLIAADMRLLKQVKEDYKK